ncbi:MAG: formylglycine-generating enzyme family protein [Luteolibacter sp.]
MKRIQTTIKLVLGAGIFLASPAFAVVSIDYATIGDAGNATDPATGSLFGAVAYEYQISKNETTISQYAEFLNAVAKTDTYGLYNTDMSTSYINGISRSGASGSFTYSVAGGSGNKPISYVSWFDAARFTNWLHNGQTVGAQSALTTEDGAYMLNGKTSGASVSKKVGATVWIPNESEWYKAAYYDPTKNAGAGGYWLNATQSDTVTSNLPGDPGAANHNDGDFAVTQNPSINPSQNYLTEVGAYGENSESHYGTNDQSGNLFEWTAADPGSSPVQRGGAWNYNDYVLSAPASLTFDPDYEHFTVGFRVASVAPVPEPSTMILSLFAGCFLLSSRRR